jgi:hypothetical protein
MPKRPPIRLLDSPLASLEDNPAALANDTRTQHGANPGASAGDSAAGERTNGSRPRSTPRRAADAATRRRTASNGAGAEQPTAEQPTPVSPLLPAGPLLPDEQTKDVFARVPVSIASDFGEMVTKIRRREGTSSQKKLAAQEILSALLWRHGNGRDADAVAELGRTLDKYRLARADAQRDRLHARLASVAVDEPGGAGAPSDDAHVA